MFSGASDTVTDDYSHMYGGQPSTDYNQPYSFQGPSSYSGLSESMTVQGMSIGYLIGFLTLALVTFIGGIVMVIYLLSGFISGVIVISKYEIIMTFAVIFLLPFSIYTVINILKRHSLEIGPEGVTLRSRKKVLFSSTWNEIKKVETHKNQRTGAISILIKIGDDEGIAVSSIYIDGKKLKEGYKLIERYCQSNYITVENNVNW